MQRSSATDPVMMTNAGRTEASPGYFLVEGKVLDQDGYPLIGATVLDPTSGRGAVTDFDGQFQLAVDTTTRQLQVSYTGFETQTFRVNPQQQKVELVLEEAASSLEEVVVLGYDKQIKSSQNRIRPPEPAVRPVGGHRAFRRYIRQNTPDGTPSGRVKVFFRIEVDGSVADAAVVEASDDRLRDLALDLLTTGPRWEIEHAEAPLEVTYVIRFRP